MISPVLGWRYFRPGWIFLTKRGEASEVGPAAGPYVLADLVYQEVDNITSLGELEIKLIRDCRGKLALV